jgi:hypothetical protein
MKNNEIFNQTKNEAPNMNDERETWSMWDPAIPAELYEYLVAS